MIEHTVQHTDLSEHGEYVLNLLRKHLGDNLPAGIYAGSAISSIVLGRIWSRVIPVVDRFELFRDYPDHIEDDSNYLVHFTLPFSGDNTLQYNGYSIISTSTEGNLVIKMCYRAEMVLGIEKRVSYILRGLGLNALQVGIYLDGSGRGYLYAEDSFLEFARTKQLRITCPVLGKTYLQLEKYQKLFDGYVDWDEEALLMSGFRHAVSADANACDDQIGIDEKLLFDQNNEQLARYCTVSGAAQLVLPGMEDMMLSRWDIEFHHPRTLEVQIHIRQALNWSGYTLTSFTYALVFNIIFRKSTKRNVKKRFWLALSNPVSSRYLFNNPRCLHYEFSIKHLEEIERFRTSHFKVVDLIMDLSSSFTTQAATILQLKRLGRLHGNPDFVFGLMEQAGHYGIKLKEISEQSIKDLISAYCSFGDTKLLEAADLSRFKYREAVNECTTSEALRWEGIRSSNCIGGYAITVSNAEGDVRIFHVHTTDDNQHSTAAIYFNRTGDIDVDFELYGPKNTVPTERHLKITNSLACFLRDSLWKPENKGEQAIDFDPAE